MAIPDHNRPNNDSNAYEYEDPIDQWLCSQCFKTISSTRPPIFNSENCSCVEVSGGGGGPASHPQTPQPEPLYNYENTTHPNPLYHNNVNGYQSYASSAISFASPEGPEGENPNLRLGNTYLSLGPDTGHGEIQHRRTASFESEMTFQMRRFLVDGGYGQTSHEHVGEEGFLKQDVAIGCESTRKGKRGSKPSWVSSGSGRASGRGELEVFGGWSQRFEMTRDTGAWMDDMGYGDVDLERGEVYPMVMSGVTECGCGDVGN